MDFKPYPQMSPSEFNEALNQSGIYETGTYPYVFTVLCNDESSTDEELKKTFEQELVVNEEAVSLIPLREYFWDSNFSVGII